MQKKFRLGIWAWIGVVAIIVIVIINIVNLFR